MARSLQGDFLRGYLVYLPYSVEVMVCFTVYTGVRAALKGKGGGGGG